MTSLEGQGIFHLGFMIKLKRRLSEVRKALMFNSIGLPVEITMSDINPNMLDVGKKRAVERGIFHGKSFHKNIKYRPKILSTQR